MKKELSFSINGVEPDTRVFVDEFGGDGVFISVHVPNANCHIVLSFDAACEMIAALQRVLETEKKVEESTT